MAVVVVEGEDFGVGGGGGVVNTLIRNANAT